jgi:hypothetical protein
MKYLTDEELEEDAERQIDYLKRAPKIPQNRAEYCIALAQLLNKPKAYIFGRMKGVEERHLAHAVSDIRQAKTKEAKVKLAMYWLRELHGK